MASDHGLRYGEFKYPKTFGFTHSCGGGSVHRAAGGKAFNPGGHKGKLHRELGIPEGQKIPAGRLSAATHSNNPEVRRDAVRARTMKKWHHV